MLYQQSRTLTVSPARPPQVHHHPQGVPPTLDIDAERILHHHRHHHHYPHHHHQEQLPLSAPRSPGVSNASWIMANNLELLWQHLHLNIRNNIWNNIPNQTLSSMKRMWENAWGRDVPITELGVSIITLSIADSFATLCVFGWRLGKEVGGGGLWNGRARQGYIMCSWCTLEVKKKGYSQNASLQNKQRVYYMR